MDSRHLTLIQPEPGQSRYAALAGALRHRIVDGEWPPGAALPAETRLAVEHGVALGTLRRALELLAEQGLIERRHGKGTFVRGGLAGATLLRFFRFGRGDGEVPQSRVFENGNRSSRRPMSLAGLESRAATRCCVCTGCDRWAVSLACSRTSGFRCRPSPRLLDTAVTDWGDLLYPLFAERCGVAVTRATDEIGFAALSARRRLAISSCRPAIPA